MVDNTHSGISYQLNNWNDTISCNSKEFVTFKAKIERKFCETLETKLANSLP